MFSKMSAKSVVLLRSPSIPDQDDKYHKVFLAQGYVPYSIPVLSFEFENLYKLSELIRLPQQHGGMILTSQRSVEALELAISSDISGVQWVESLKSQWQSLPLFAVGSATSKAMKDQLGLTSSGHEAGSAEKLVPIIKQAISSDDKPLLFPCGNLRKETIPTEMENAGIQLSSVQAYTTCAHPKIQEALEEQIKAKGLPSVVVFFSPSGLEYSFNILKELAEDIRNIKLVAIGNTTSKAMHDKGIGVDGIAEKPNPESLCQCIEICCQNGVS